MCRFFAFMLVVLTFSLASCSVKKIKADARDEAYQAGLNKISSLYMPSQDGGRLIDIAALYDKFSPGQSGFDALFKKNLPDTAYRRYARLLKEKLAYHRKKKRFFEVKLLSKKKISRRKREAKKEWAWGKSRKVKLSEYYRYFRRPFMYYEHKVSYRTTPVDDSGVVDLAPKKVISTDQHYVLFFYKAKGDGKVYLIDPDVFIQSIL